MGSTRIATRKFASPARTRPGWAVTSPACSWILGCASLTVSTSFRQYKFHVALCIHFCRVHYMTRLNRPHSVPPQCFSQLGRSRTPRDVPSEHTGGEGLCFLDYDTLYSQCCSLQPRSFLLLCCCWECAGTASSAVPMPEVCHILGRTRARGVEVQRGAAMSTFWVLEKRSMQMVDVFYVETLSVLYC